MRFSLSGIELDELRKRLKIGMLVRCRIIEKVGDKRFVLRSTVDGYATRISNEAIRRIARAAGCPEDKGAGVYLHVKRGAKVSVGEALIEIYAESESELDKAIELAKKLVPIRVEGMVLERIGHKMLI